MGLKCGKDKKSMKGQDIILGESNIKKFREKIKANYVRCLKPVNLMGLSIEKGNQPIPLKSICYEIQIQHSISRVVLNQEYFNNNENPIEAVFFFAISNEACFDSFEAQIDDKIVKGVVKERVEAKKEYEEEKKKGNVVAYSEVNKKTQDIMKVNIGNLPPKKTVIIKFSYYENLQVCVNKFWRFILPSTFTPRYSNQPSNNPDDNIITNPNVISSKNPNAYTWKIKGSIDSSSLINFFKSPSHPDTNFNYTKENKKQLTFEMGSDTEEFPNKDFVLLFRDDEINQPSVVLSKNNFEKKSFSYGAMLTFFPNFNESNVDDAYKSYLEDSSNEYEINSAKATGEYIFLIDRSGSMSGHRIEMAKNSLILFLKSIPINSYCNIFSFGSNFTSLYPKSQKVDENLLNKMVSEVEQMGADMGGTEIYDALLNINESDLIPKYPRCVFLLTDGGVSNTETVLNLIDKMSSKCKLYTFGVGNGCSTQLIEEGALLGNGKYEFVGDNEDLNEKTEVSLECYNGAENKKRTFPLIIRKDMCEDIPGIFKLGIKKTLKQLTRMIVLEKKVENDIYFAKIGDIEKDSLELSLKFQILNEFTAFICTIQEAVKAPNKPPQKIIVPIIESVDYHSDEEDRGYENSLKQSKGTGFRNLMPSYTTNMVHKKHSDKPSNILKSAFKKEGDICNIKLDSNQLCLNEAAPRLKNMEIMESFEGIKDMEIENKRAMPPFEESFMESFETKNNRAMPIFSSYLEESKELENRISFEEEEEQEKEYNENENRARRNFIPNKLEEEETRSKKIDSNQNTFMKIVKMQKITGIWEFSSEFLYEFKISETDFYEPLKDSFKKDENYFMTIIVMVWLEYYYTEKKNSWKLIHKKAADALKSNGKDFSLLFEHAKNLLTAL